MTPAVAIIGANGFIGTRAVEMFHLNGWAHPRPVVRRPEALARACRFVLDARVANARDERALAVALLGCDSVVHAVAGDPTTIMGTIDPVYRAADAAGVRRLIYLSSASVHGQSPPPGTDETSPLSHRQPIAYNNAKVRAEQRLRQLRRDGSVEIVILRPGIVFGPRSYWTAGFADELLAGEAYLVGGGKGVCNSLYVDNLVHAIRLAIVAPKADGKAYLLGDGEEITWADLCRPIANALGFSVDDLPHPAPETVTRSRPTATLHVPEIAHRMLSALPTPLYEAVRAGVRAWRTQHAASVAAPRPAQDVTLERALLHCCQYRLPWARAEAELGYQPIVAIEDALRRSVAWLQFAGYPVVSAAPRNTWRDDPERGCDDSRSVHPLATESHADVP